MTSLRMSQIARDFASEGIPSSGKHKIRKNDLREWGGWVEDIVGAIGANGGGVYTSKAAIDADLAHGANSMAWVVGDPVAANNGIYRKIGSSGTGSWARVADLPYGLIEASDSGAGTPNAIIATSDIPISSSALVMVNVFEANTSTPVTIAFNGGSTLTIKTNGGNDLSPGGLVAGMFLLGVVSGSTFRLVSDQASAAVLASAEDARDQAAAYADFARNNWAVAASGTGTGAEADIALLIDPGSVNNMFVTVGGVGQMVTQGAYSLVYSGGSPYIRINVPTGVPYEVRVSNAISIGTPSDGTVSTAKLADGAVTTPKLGDGSVTLAKLASAVTALITAKASITGVETLTNKTLTAPALNSPVINLPQGEFLRGYMSGLVLSNNAGDAANDIDFAAGAAGSNGVVPVLMVLSSLLTKRADAAWAVGSGNGGFDSGTIANGVNFGWLIGRSDTGVIDGLISASSTAPVMPANYDWKVLVGSFIRSSAVNKAPRSYSQREPTGFVAYTPIFTGFGPVSAVSVLSRRVADALELYGKFTAGTATATEARISLGFGGIEGNVIADATKNASLRLCGTWLSSAVGAYVGSMLIEPSAGYLTLGIQNASIAGTAKANGDAISASGRVMTFTASIPIAGW